MRGWTFSLSSLFLVVTCIAICLGVGIVSPGWGVACCLLLPAVIRTTQLVRQEIARSGCNAGVGLTLFLFFESVVVIGCVLIPCGVVTIGLIAPGAFLAIGPPFGDGPGPLAQVTGCVFVGLGLLASITVLIACLRAIWSKRQF